ncbi:SDR family oxidoreductase [Aestuariivirga litoralis]|uniref:SDR family oxidoreductase n=1 Tax=Aestuariivirga litoralis TaxID=2650924 RepID=UPI0018C4C531|nr:SDR family oxidoreductase [Aestuariivirga litoralis]MBG1230956.1 SDR family oxidoreductase [Aestuariivirga litoralis]
MSGILITGAGKRIGRQLALDLAEAGHDIAVHYGTSKSDASEVAGLIKAMGRRVALVKGDLADEDIAERLINAATAELGPLEGLINSASIFEGDEVGKISTTSWQRHMDINLRAPVMLAQEFARQLPADMKGNIINITDQRVWKLNPRFFSYTLSKAGLWTATQTLAQALAPRIRVNAIGPGPALPSARMDQAEFAKQESLTLLGRGTSPKEISEAAKFILSQPALTGQMIALDGGQHLVWQTRDVVEVSE